jgi:hypothetical protein
MQRSEVIIAKTEATGGEKQVAFHVEDIVHKKEVAQR